MDDLCAPYYCFCHGFACRSTPSQDHLYGHKSCYPAATNGVSDGDHSTVNTTTLYQSFFIQADQVQDHLRHSDKYSNRTSTVTETATVDAMQKRDPSPLFTPPKGSGHDYKPPLLLGFAPAVISAACSCIVTPTTVTVTSTSEATATATQTVTKPAITTTVATVTDVVTVTVISVETVTAAPSTSTITESTTTTAVPVQTCNGVPGLPQQSVTGFLQPRATEFPPRILTPTLADPSAEACYNICKSFRPPGGDPNPIRAYSFNPTQTKPLQSLPGVCVCYEEQLCSFFTNDPAGDTIGGDTQLPFQ
ncbi:MAG: hypothetical protein Q9206_003707 [Seirophora lacunosa]